MRIFRKNRLLKSLWKTRKSGKVRSRGIIGESSGRRCHDTEIQQIRNFAESQWKGVDDGVDDGVDFGVKKSIRVHFFHPV